MQSLLKVAFSCWTGRLWDVLVRLVNVCQKTMHQIIRLTIHVERNRPSLKYRYDPTFNSAICKTNSLKVILYILNVRSEHALVER